MSHCSNRPLFVCPALTGVWVVSILGTNADTVAVNILDSVFGGHTHTFLFDTYLGVELLGIRIFFSLPLVNTAKEFSTITELRISSVDESFHCIASLLTPGSLRISSVYESFHCVASLLTPGSLQVFYSSHFGGCEEVAGWGFWFILFSFFSWLVLI